MVTFKDFKVGELFETKPYRNGEQVLTGGNVPASLLQIGDTPRISVSSKNNGIVGYYQDVEMTSYRVFENAISVSFLGTVFYHPYRASYDMKVHCLRLQDHELRECEALYLVSVLRKAVDFCSYGNQLSSTELVDIEISLPVQVDENDNPLLNDDGNFVPDWDYMESTIRELEESTIRELDAYLKETGLDDYHLTDAEHALLEREPMFCAFSVGELFEMYTVSKKLTKAALSLDGTVPVYSSDTRNNGVLGYTEQEPTFIVDAVRPTYMLFGDHTRTINIVHESFCVMDNVKVLSPKFDLSDEVLLYIKTVWLKGIPVLGYARHWSVAKDVALSLPVKPSTDLSNYTQDDIDWDYMVSYVRAMEKQVIADVVDYKNEVIALTKGVCHK